MSLDNFYALRKNFIILGLTGKMQAGADKFAKLLTQDSLDINYFNFMDEFQSCYSKISDSESRKVRRLKDFFSYKENWIKFDVIEYKNVILLFLLNDCYDVDKNTFINQICNKICELGNIKKFKNPRFGNSISLANGSEHFIKNEFKETLNSKWYLINNINLSNNSLLENLLNNNGGSTTDNDFFFQEKFMSFANEFFKSLDSFSIYLRHVLIHDLSHYLRRFGVLKISTLKKGLEKQEANEHENLDNIYCIAHVINRLIKIHRKSKKDKAHIIIDRLKNSYEMMYFREKYSGFYMVVNNRNEEQRINDISKKIDYFSYSEKDNNLKYINILDETEYKTSAFKKGGFASFDVENCVQKSDYHIWYDEKFDLLSTYSDEKVEKLDKTNELYIYQPYFIQVLKLIALIQQPGLITPTYPERVMQIAYNAKLNSGCISRQVGAVVTDKNFSIKGIGWNDVPVGQVPCSNRDLRDFKLEERQEFTNFERGKTDHMYSDGESFRKKLIRDYEIKEEELEKNLNGRPCAYCFKTFHNLYEGKENQVHTRSLHAEENAMMQISKYGGQGLQGGNLFTTASPCELCAKKAYQLGIKNIFYIDLYPGISRHHILEGGKNNPLMFQFQGVLGKSYQKLYEPFMAIKDETLLRSNIRPTETVKETVKETAKQIQEIIHATLIEDHKNPNDFDKIKDNPVLLNEITNLLKKI
ncbi:hypothetical protein HZP31_09285 [Elizabethkingia anophelis]|uniref:hypothetical protein n=1 Tax=Elizabethkingia anophelis TaxID=1117645 RepID=UPI0021A2F5E1|nr:hypothetical protein [Elizabethkingia anophelis]MCT4265917.1 hypothetical protein [Elizabethkingia anophelis]MCT4269817.1 hypothetical protein [Elizabethkingia anophelis]